MYLGQGQRTPICWTGISSHLHYLCLCTCSLLSGFDWICFLLLESNVFNDVFFFFLAYLLQASLIVDCCCNLERNLHLDEHLSRKSLQLKTLSHIDPGRGHHLQQQHICGKLFKVTLMQASICAREKRRIQREVFSSILEYAWGKMCNDSWIQLTFSLCHYLTHCVVGGMWLPSAWQV